MNERQVDLLCQPRPSKPKRGKSESGKKFKKDMRTFKEDYESDKQRRLTARNRLKTDFDCLIKFAQGCDPKLCREIFPPDQLEKLIIAVVRKLKNERYYPKIDTKTMTKEYKNIRDLGDMRESTNLPYAVFIIRAVKVGLKDEYLRGEHGFYYDISITQKIDLKHISLSEFE